MTIDVVQNLGSTVQYIATLGQTVFPVPFPFVSTADIIAQVGTVTLANGTDYTVSGAGNDTGGSVILAVGAAANAVYTITRDIAVDRLTEYQQNGPFTAAAINAELDNIVLIEQQLKDRIGRAIRIPVTSTAPSAGLELNPAAFAGAALTMDAQGNILPGVFATTPITQAIIASLLTPATSAENAAGVVPSAFQYQPGDIRRYGALTTAPDNTVSLQRAIAQALKTGGSTVRIPCGTWSYATGLVVNGPIQIIGDDMYTTILRKTANVVGMTISDGVAPGQVSLFGFTLSSAGGDSSVGLSINTVGRPRCRQLFVTGHGSHGIELVQCTVGRFDDISSVSNAGDGIKLTGSGGVQANANTFTNIDARGNTGWGMNLLTAMSNMGTGITVQSNTAGGIQLGACFGNLLDVYSESNTGPDINFTAACVAPSFGGNMVRLALVSSGITFSGASAAVNSITTIRNGSTFQPGNSQLITDSLVLPSVSTQGAAVTGSFAWTHSINAEADFTINGLAASGITNFKNAAGGANLHIVGVDNLRLNAAAVNSGAGAVALGSTTASTVGAAGGATVLPASPLGYLIANVAGTQVKIPYYNN